ncbi:MAG: DUF86 domain-containing protein [Candidatus Hatepunaea meridiana]|nr:DUF86 domain-containing protein [Candidatus Hatepunaea meridiana]
MIKDDMVYLGHMLDYALRAVCKVKDINRDDFDDNDDLRLALVHLIQIVGEAARLVSDECREKYPVIPWTKIIGMRHRIVHNYINIQFRIVWDVVKYELPSLVEELEKIVPPEEFTAD